MSGSPIAFLLTVGVIGAVPDPALAAGGAIATLKVEVILVEKEG